MCNLLKFPLKFGKFLFRRVFKISSQAEELQRTSSEITLNSEISEKLFYLQFRCIGALGFDRERLTKYPVLSRVAVAINILIMAFCILGEAYFISTNYTDVLGCAESAAPMFIEFTCIIKIATYYWMRERLFSIMDEIKSLSEEAKISDLIVIKKANKFDQNIVSLYLALAGFSGFYYCFSPFLINYINMNYFGKPFKHLTPFIYSYPFDITLHPAYEITYGIFMVATYISVMILVGIDSLFHGICLNLCAHFDILRESVIDDKKKFIEYHQKILNLAAIVDGAAKPIVVNQFLVTAMHICVLGFQVILHPDYFKRMVAVTFLGTVVVQLFVYAHGGQLIMDKSSEVAQNFYETDKDFVVIIARTQKPAVINAVFSVANLPTFTSVLNSATAYITLLKSFIE